MFLIRNPIGIPNWRIIPFSRWLITTVIGSSLTGFIFLPSGHSWLRNYLPNGMILQLSKRASESKSEESKLHWLWRVYDNMICVYLAPKWPACWRIWPITWCRFFPPKKWLQNTTPGSRCCIACTVAAKSTRRLVTAWMHLLAVHAYLRWKSVMSFPGWWLNQPIWKICSSNWITSPWIGVKI